MEFNLKMCKVKLTLIFDNLITNIHVPNTISINPEEQLYAM